jgi:hypothetical protein
MMPDSPAYQGDTVIDSETQDVVQKLSGWKFSGVVDHSHGGERDTSGDEKGVDLTFSSEDGSSTYVVRCDGETLRIV